MPHTFHIWYSPSRFRKYTQHKLSFFLLGWMCYARHPLTKQSAMEEEFAKLFCENRLPTQMNILSLRRRVADVASDDDDDDDGTPATRRLNTQKRVPKNEKAAKT